MFSLSYFVLVPVTALSLCCLQRLLSLAVLQLIHPLPCPLTADRDREGEKGDVRMSRTEGDGEKEEERKRR